jgi:limonene-1,2-epoxide hydrolase
MATQARGVDRRTFLTASTVAAAFGLPRLLSAEEWTAAEQDNVKVVNDFLHTRWLAPTMDWDKLASYLAEDAVWGNRTNNLVRGRQAIIEECKKTYGNPKRDLKILQTFAIGPIVVNDRLDSGVPVVGVFEVRDGLIKEWRAFGK